MTIALERYNSLILCTSRDMVFLRYFLQLMASQFRQPLPKTRSIPYRMFWINQVHWLLYRFFTTTLKQRTQERTRPEEAAHHATIEER